MPIKRSTTFTRGSGCYACRVCKRKTRDDGHGDSAGVRLCTQCYELAGIENEISDGWRDPNHATRIADIIAELVAKGGNAGSWADLLIKAKALEAEAEVRAAQQ